MEVNLTDTHTHLCDPAFDDDRKEVLENARTAGICAIVLVGENLADAAKNQELAKQYPILKPAAGLYPAILDEAEADEINKFILKNRERLVAIGEVGLDHWVVKTENEKALQKAIFKSFINLALKVDLPLNVHSRSAGRHAISLLLECGAKKVQLHAFDGKASTALPAVDAGYFFSIPPSILRSRQKQKLVKHLPLKCLLLETDSPVLGPVLHVRNQPSNIIHSLDAIAKIKGVSKEAVIEAVTVNTKKLYGGDMLMG